MGLFLKFVEGSLTLVLVYLLVANARGFSTIVGAAGTQYTSVIKTLQGR